MFGGGGARGAVRGACTGVVQAHIGPCGPGTVWAWPGPILALCASVRTKMHMALLEDSAYVQGHFEFYNKVWGFDFSAMKVQRDCTGEKHRMK